MSSLGNSDLQPETAPPTKSMARLVQKFGGSSVKDSKHIQNAAKIVADAFRTGKEIVVVVSAMGDSTDQLIEMANQISSNPDPRELDVLLATGEQVSIAMLCLALKSLGLQARSFTGPQAGILTDDTHGYARIKTVHPTRLENSLRHGEIAVVAGFQGMTRTSELTTLGRGGSDTTAVALAAALKAECCDIYTDVDGIYSTDPRTVGRAKKLRAISYEEMLALASAGAQVLNPRSVELAMKTGVAIRLRSTFQPDDTGTLVTKRELAPDYQICGVACDSDRISMHLSLCQNFDPAEQAADRQHLELLIERLQEIGVHGSSMVFKNTGGLQISDLEFTCEKRIARQVQSAVSNAMCDLPGSQLKINTGIARISIIGNAVSSDAQLKNQLLDTLTKANIPVTMLSSDKICISAVVSELDKDEAIRQVHARFCQESTNSLDLILH